MTQLQAANRRRIKQSIAKAGGAETRISRAWRGSGFGCGGNNRARSLQVRKVAISTNLFHIREERDLG